MRGRAHRCRQGSKETARLRQIGPSPQIAAPKLGHADDDDKLTANIADLTINCSVRLIRSAETLRNTEDGCVADGGILVCAMPTTAVDPNYDEIKKCPRIPAPPVSSAWRYWSCSSAWFPYFTSIAKHTIYEREPRCVRVGQPSSGIPAACRQTKISYRRAKLTRSAAIYMEFRTTSNLSSFSSHGRVFEPFEFAEGRLSPKLIAVKNPLTAGAGGPNLRS